MTQIERLERPLLTATPLARTAFTAASSLRCAAVCVFLRITTGSQSAPPFMFMVAGLGKRGWRGTSGLREAKRECAGA
jgi:hypothetical protein